MSWHAAYLSIGVHAVLVATQAQGCHVEPTASVGCRQAPAAHDTAQHGTDCASKRLVWQGVAQGRQHVRQGAWRQGV